ncbi:MAG: hypothetical protein M1475_08970 [Actinobacteria bacterium]|nr:hypothetical protein [Actinomycetota bacterium]MCL6088531.1 hypothetical protein [Actinomycetota bacterium]
MEDKIKKSKGDNFNPDISEDISEKKEDAKDLNAGEHEVSKAYRKILEKHEKRKAGNTKSANIAVILICILILITVSFNAYLIKSEKNKENMIREAQAEIEREKQAELDRIKEETARRNKVSAEILNFNDKYLIIRKDFYLKVEDLTKKLSIKVNSIQEIKELTDERIKLMQDYKNKLSLLSIPEVLNDFYQYEINFLDSDIKLWNIISVYYSLDDTSKFDINKINEETKISHELYLKAQQELESVYNKYDLNYYLKDLIIK